MISSLKELPDDASIRADVAVVGSGPAGAEVATYLARKGHAVVVVESGGQTFEPQIQALTEAEFAGRPHRLWRPGADFHGYLAPQYRGLNRVRQLGGTSVTWTGKWRPFDAAQVEGRDWLPDSRWPIGWSELQNAYREVSQDYGLGVGAGDRLEGELAAQAGAFCAAGLKVVPFAQHEKPLRTAPTLRAVAGDTLCVLLDATVLRIELADGSDRVAGLVCRSLDGTERRIVAEHVVLAAGGFDTPRLLLASNHQHPAGLGNGHDLVGRFYQDHLKLKSIRLRLGPLLRQNLNAVRNTPRPRLTLSFGLPDAEQRRLGITDATLFLRPVYRTRLGALRDAVLFRREVHDGTGALDHYAVTFAMEQVVNRESRVTLSRERDGIGMRRLRIDWRLADLDRQSFDASIAALTTLADRSGLGRLDLGREPPSFEQATDAAHHMGTTRMSASPRQGVVDPGGTVWGHPNLHVASSSVFPTGGAYSPTFTIVALARRLAARLDRMLAQPIVASRVRRAG
jgi:choline dehydrogenase-like flavoprotein